MDGAELLQAVQVSGGQAGVGQVAALLGTAGATGAGQAALAGERGAAGGVALQPGLQVALLIQMLVHKLMVLEGVGARYRG